MKRLKLVLSCYACEPNRGSEPGVGWAWALGMAKRHETYVLTRANNREVIEAELARLNLPPTETPNFIYVDLSPFICRLKKRGIVPVSLYYLLWQFKARKTLDSLHLNADIIHHVTFCSFMIPGVWWRRKEKVVIGPIGGMCICPPAFFRLFRGKLWLKEVARTALLRLWRLNMFYWLGKKHADAMLFIDEKTRKAIGGGAKRTLLMMDTAVPMELEDSKYDLPPLREGQFVFAGVIEPRKGLEIALRAYAKAFSGEPHRPAFKVFGQGRDLEWNRRLAVRLGIAENVQFCGKVAQNVLWEEVRKSLALVFPSVRDTCGSINVEAMALQTPVICFNHQGVGEVTDDTCAIRIEPNEWYSASEGFASAMVRLERDRTCVGRLGQNGRKRALANFTWEKKVGLTDCVYSEVFF